MIYPYASTEYSRAFKGLGQVTYIESLGVSAILRNIPGTDRVDAAALYPMAWPIHPESATNLRAELAHYNAVSLVLVVDPFCDAIADGWLPDIFDLARPYKTHYMRAPQNNAQPVVPLYSRHHRRNVRLAKSSCTLREVAFSSILNDWHRLYDVLIARNKLTGIHQFSRSYFEELCDMPGLRTFGAFVGDDLVAASLWFAWNNHVMLHLAASSTQGYKCGAAFGNFDLAVQHFSDRSRINFGGEADLPPSPNADSAELTGLGRFKSGFANETRQSWICGLVADQDAYQSLCARNDVNTQDFRYFPAYRGLLL